MFVPKPNGMPTPRQARSRGTTRPSAARDQTLTAISALDVHDVGVTECRCWRPGWRRGWRRRVPRDFGLLDHTIDQGGARQAHGWVYHVVSGSSSEYRLHEVTWGRLDLCLDTG